MNCHEARNNLLLAQAGELSARRRAATERHLAGCEACREYRAAMDGVVSAVRGAPLERDVSPFAIHRIQEEARRLAPDSKSARRREPSIQPGFLELWRPAAFSAAAALVMLALGVVLLRQLAAPRVEVVQDAAVPPAAEAASPAPRAWTTDVDAAIDELWLLLADAGAGLEGVSPREESLESLAGDLLELEGWNI